MDPNLLDVFDTAITGATQIYNTVNAPPGYAVDPATGKYVRLANVPTAAGGGLLGGGIGTLLIIGGLIYLASK